MLAIAARCKLGTVEACEALLEKWYRQQDQTLISSSEEDVMEDISRIAAWADGEGLLEVTSRPCIKKSDADRILQQPTKLRRKILFYLTARINDSKYMRYRVSVRNLAAAVKASPQGVQKAIGGMCDDGSIMYTSSGRRIWSTSSGVESEASVYQLPVTPIPEVTPHNGIDSVDIDFQRMQEGIDAVYYETLQELYPMQTLKQYLSRSEVAQLQQYKKERYDYGPRQHEEPQPREHPGTQ